MLQKRLSHRVISGKHVVMATAVICIFISFSIVHAAVSRFDDGLLVGGSTGLSSGLTVDVAGRIGATEYCDELGNNCVDIAASGSMGGSGTGGYVARFTNATTIGNGAIQDNGSRIGIGRAPHGSHRVDVNGNIGVRSGHVYLGSGLGQDLYGDNGQRIYYDSNHSTITSFEMRDAENTRYGLIYGDGNGANFGLLDGDGNWGVRLIKDSHVELRDNNEVVFDAGQGGVSGNYGTVSTEGGGKGGWEGYSINGRAVFMHDGGSATGIYNDVNNEWLLYAVHNAEVRLRYNNADKLQTRTDGIDVTGNIRADDYCNGSGANCFQRHSQVNLCPFIASSGNCNNECVGQLTTATSCNRWVWGCVSSCGGKDPNYGCVATAANACTAAGYLVN